MPHGTRSLSPSPETLGWREAEQKQNVLISQQEGWQERSRLRRVTPVATAAAASSTFQLGHDLVPPRCGESTSPPEAEAERTRGGGWDCCAHAGSAQGYTGLLTCGDP